MSWHILSSLCAELRDCGKAYRAYAVTGAYGQTKHCRRKIDLQGSEVGKEVPRCSTGLSLVDDKWIVSVAGSML